MLEKILEKCYTEETMPNPNADDIKTAVLSRIEEDKPLKHFKIKPFLIAAAITATGAASLVTANAATDNAITNYLMRTFSPASVSESTTPVKNDAPSTPEESTPAKPDKAITVEEWGKEPHTLPSEFAPEDLDFVNTTNGWNGSRNITIYADRGSEVYAVDDGEVIFADYNCKWNGGCGCVVVIEHAEGLYTIYSHLLDTDESGRDFVSAGDQVMAGQCIGLAGSSGHIDGNGVSYGFWTELPQFVKDELL